MARGKSKTSPLNVKFGKRLGALRQERGWTYTYMSEHSGVATTFLHGLEHGTKEPCLNTLDVLAKSFDMTMSELLKGI
ncbi:MAG: helix-turn-helix transcriptional regulator [Candidatus Sulfotelmatobacter sp.]